MTAERTLHRSGNDRRFKALLLTQYDLPEHKRNMNAYQRIHYGSQYAEIFLLMRRGQTVSDNLQEKVHVHWAPVFNRWLFFIFAILYAMFLRLQGCRIILTGPDGYAAVGLAVKVLAGYFWVMDVWDRPRWRTGKHEQGQQIRLTDRIVFRTMRYADLYLLSCLPRAAKDMKPPQHKIVQLYNAIDLSFKAESPPNRSREDQTLHLSYGRSKFHETMGLDVVIQAAEIMKRQNVPIMIHLIGNLSDQSIANMENSPAADCFKFHGFVTMTRQEFFRNVHAGLVPYLALEDLSHIFPIKVLEHLNQGNPVIASRVPGLAATIKHEYNGLLVEPGNAEDLAKAMARLQKDYDLWERLAWNALESIDQYEVGKKHRLIFESIADRGGIRK